VRVLGPLDDLPRLVERLGIKQAIVAMPGQAHAVRRRAVKLCSDAGVPALTVPSYENLVAGRVRTAWVFSARAKAA